MTPRYPLKLAPILRHTIWGGDTLCREWNKPTLPEGRLGESWELSVRPEATSVIENGACAGLSLQEYIRLLPEAVGTCTPADRFPILIKLIDADDALSVQVHPDDVYADRVEGDNGKNEMWYVLDAEEGATIVYGLKGHPPKSDMAALIKDGGFTSLLHTVPVKKGDVFFVPAGLVHAIGSGVLIAEIQQNCDLTYRLFDYGRRGPDGMPRALHVEKALDVIRPFSPREIEALRYESATALTDTLLAHCRYFKAEVLLPCQGGALIRHAGAESFHALLVLSGHATLIANGQAYEVKKGDSYFLPAGMGDYTVEGDAELLLTSLT